MPAKAKVGSWLEDSGSAAASEAYESSEAGSSGSSSGSEAGDGSSQTGNVNGTKLDRRNVDEDEEDEDEEPDEREEEVDWDALLPKIRPAVMDRSEKRRESFISRYLVVTQQGT